MAATLASLSSRCAAVYILGDLFEVWLGVATLEPHVAPVAACVAYARERVARGADVVALGHFHRFEVVEVEGGGRKGLLVVLPFWHDEPRPVLFDREGRIVE